MNVLSVRRDLSRHPGFDLMATEAAKMRRRKTGEKTWRQAQMEALKPLLLGLKL